MSQTDLIIHDEKDNVAVVVVDKITKDQEYTREVETKRKKQTQNWQSEKEQKVKGKEKQILKIS